MQPQFVTVKNPGRRPVTLQLVHEQAPRTKVPFTQLLSSKDGKTAQKRLTLRLPDSLTVGPGEVKTDQPAWIGQLARDAGLTVTLQPVEPDAPGEPEPPKKTKTKGSK